MIVTRFAPSPNGYLHLGHAFSAIVAHDLAKEQGGRFVLRIEDIDGARSRTDMADAIREDLEWLGLSWEEVPAQSTRLTSYKAAAQILRERGLLYPCTCTRSDIQAAKPQMGPMGAIYPGTCRGCYIAPADKAIWRLDMVKAQAEVGDLNWCDAVSGEQKMAPHLLGDVVLWRKDEPASYHLAATIDDAADGVTLVTRGRDLFAATHVHRLLQALLGLPVPQWHHHGIVLDVQGKKLAKSRGSASLAERRKLGVDGLLLAEQLRLQSFPSGISLEKD